MKTQAVDKLKKEMDNSKNNKYVEVIGKFLIGHIEQNEAFAEHILKASKSIKGSLNAMKQEAQKQQQGGMVVLTDEEGFAIVVSYFEAAEEEKPQKKEEAKAAPAETQPVVTGNGEEIKEKHVVVASGEVSPTDLNEPTEDDFDIDDLL